MPRKGHITGCQCSVCRAVDAKVAKVARETLELPKVETVESILDFSLGQQVWVTEGVRDIPSGTIVFIDGKSTPEGKYKVIFRNRPYWINENLLRR